MKKEDGTSFYHFKGGSTCVQFKMKKENEALEKTNYEIEMKFLLPSYGKEELIKKLINLGAIDKGKKFENNILFDTEDKALDKKDYLLRLRRVNDRNILTFKGAAKKNVSFKIRKEIESEISDFDNMIEILKSIGYQIKFIYQKYRSSFHLNNLDITIDELPFGTYIEIEGEKEKILSISKKLNLKITEISNITYFDLYISECKRKNIEPSSYTVFEDYDLSHIISK